MNAGDLMKIEITPLFNGSGTYAVSAPGVGRKPIFGLLMRVLWTAALLLPAFGAQGGAVFTSLYSLDLLPDGANSYAPLVQGRDGNFYGTAYNGGTNGGNGTVFKISTNGAYTSLYSFTGSSDGANPAGGLVEGSDDNFYGMTANGGTNGDGGVFKLSTNGVLIPLYSFGAVQDVDSNAIDGANPVGGLAQGSDGNFYGATQNGGTLGQGTLFKISTNGELNSLYTFGYAYHDGANPAAGLVLGSDGNFYGTTPYGGGNGGDGTVFIMSTSGAVTTLHTFTDADDGANPYGGLVQGTDGEFYGTTYSGGGTNYAGNVFKISTNGVVTGLYSFTGGADGFHPYAGLVQGSDGNFYGTTQNGGTSDGYSGYGTVFSISTNGALTTLYTFTGGSDGAGPTAGLVQGSDGRIYGTSPEGGYGGAGTVFRLTIVPEFLAVNPANRTLSLTWSTEAGGRYQLQYNPELRSGNWTNLGSPFTATGATRSTTDSLTSGPQRFYRVVLLP